MTLLSEKVIESQFTGLPDWQVSNLLSQPDSNLPLITEWQNKKLGLAEIIEAIGTARGFAVLTSAAALAESEPAFKWSLEILTSGNCNLFLSTQRDFIMGLSQSPISLITEQEVTAIFALAKIQRYPSWSEYNEVFVDARAVGIARGGL